MQFQKISIPTTRKVIGNSKGEGASKAKIFQKKALKKKTLEFSEGWGRLKLKKPSVGGVQIFSGTTHYCLQFFGFEGFLFQLFNFDGNFGYFPV